MSDAIATHIITAKVNAENLVERLSYLMFAGKDRANEYHWGCILRSLYQISADVAALQAMDFIPEAAWPDVTPLEQEANAQ